MNRVMDWPPRFGVDHPSWDAPDSFVFKTKESAQQAILHAYGANSGHVVVELRRVES